MRTLLVVAFVYSVVHPCTLVAAEEIKFPSPDGRFALRITQPKDDEYHPTVELIEKDSGKVMVTLHSASDTELFDASESALVWSADSKSRGGCLFLERLRFRQSVFAGEPAGARDQISQGKRRGCETLRRRGETLEVVEVRGSGDVQRGRGDVARQNLYRRAALYDFVRRTASPVRKKDWENENRGGRVNEKILCQSAVADRRGGGDRLNGLGDCRRLARTPHPS